MNKTAFVILSCVLGILLTSCASTAKERDAWTKKYEALKANPQVETYSFPDNERFENTVNSAVSVCNASRKYALEYIAATENHREYQGFCNDVDYYVTEEKLDFKTAWEKVAQEIQAEDAKISDPAERKWARVMEGYAAVNALKPMNKLTELGMVAVDIAKCVQAINETKEMYTIELYNLTQKAMANPAAEATSFVKGALGGKAKLDYNEKLAEAQRNLTDAVGRGASQDEIAKIEEQVKLYSDIVGVQNKLNATVSVLPNLYKTGEGVAFLIKQYENVQKAQNYAK